MTLCKLRMPYQTKLHPKVVEFLNKLPSDISERIKKKIKSIEENPFRYLEHYEGEDFFKLRIGDYRALVDVDTSRKILFVRVLDHRRRIYKR